MASIPVSIIAVRVPAGKCRRKLQNILRRHDLAVIGGVDCHSAFGFEEETSIEYKVTEVDDYRYVEQFVLTAQIRTVTE